MTEIIIGDNEAGQRLNKFLMKYLNKAPSGFIYKMLRKKNIKLNGVKAFGNEILCKGDSVKLFMSDETIIAFRDEQAGRIGSAASGHFKLQVIYRDDDILIADKPAGMLSQKASQSDYSMNDALKDYLLDNNIVSMQDYVSFRPSVCNRLDRNTSGIILCGISLKGSQELSRLLRERRIDKYYLTIVCGSFEKSRRCDAFLIKDEKTNRVYVSKDVTPEKNLQENRLQGKARCKTPEKIITEYIPIRSCGDFTLLKVKLLTGKPHQIRAHLAYLGYPVIGDAKYGDAKTNKHMAEKYGLRHQLLHCSRIVFPDENFLLSDSLKGCEFNAPKPDIFNTIERDLFG